LFCRDPIVVGVRVEAGIIKTGTPICVPSKEFIYIGICTGIQHNNKVRLSLSDIYYVGGCTKSLAFVTGDPAQSGSGARLESES
jgi:hypothetical protein